MKLTIGLLCIFVLIVTIGAPPVVENANENAQKDNSKNDAEEDDILNNLEYGRYLKEVFEILESDQDFKKQLEGASSDDIKSGDIAQHLSLVQHNVRTKLDEAKQREMLRLKELVGQKVRNLNEKDRLALARANPKGLRIKEFLPQHVDSKNWETFGRVDLERLIQHATKDLDELDRKRERQFKEYEMRKEYERRAKLARLDIDERKRLQKVHEELLEKKKRHKKVNHPGSVDQMEEVWEKVDKFEADQFSPKAFFKLHDINGDEYLDDAEVEAIMLKEAAKIHDETPEGDPIEKQEEMDRMREHVMKEFDKDADRMISFKEFQAGIKGSEAKNDKGWQSVEDKPAFSDQEFQKFSEKMVPVSTSIPPYQTPSPAGNQQAQGLPVAAAAAQPAPAPPQPQQQQNPNPQPPPQVQQPQQQQNPNPQPPPQVQQPQQQQNPNPQPSLFPK